MALACPACGVGQPDAGEVVPDDPSSGRSSSDSEAPGTGGTSGGTTGTGNATDAEPGDGVDPFAEQPDEGEGLVNVSSDLEELLEFGALEGACEAYAADPSDRHKKLLCGKSMFFYESFDTDGVPELLVNFFGEHFPDEVGDGFSQMGMVPDPYAERSRPLGLAPTKPMGTADALAYTCASCHFGQMPDGRYAVGYPNYRYEYGKQILSLVIVPTLAAPGADPSVHDPAALEVVAPIRDKLSSDPLLNLQMAVELLPLLPVAGEGLGMSAQNEHHYATWAPGTMDFVIEPLPYDDGVHTISKILPLWGIPRAEESDAFGMTHAMLSWTGTVPTLEGFLEGFVLLGGGDTEAWTSERLEPLAEYIYSLRAPKSLDPPDPAEVEAGRDAFWSLGCIDCHSGPRGSGLEVYTYDEIGTDDAMARWLDPEGTGDPCCGITLLPGQTLTGGIKSPRLTGVWAFERFLHNGSVTSLRDLMCLDGPRGDAGLELAYGDGGHSMSCDGLSDEDKNDLIAFLRSI
jgi:hypothetical protein